MTSLPRRRLLSQEKVAPVRGSRAKPPIESSEQAKATDRSEQTGWRSWSDPQFARAITDRSECQHTAYIELCPEKLLIKPSWNTGALYFTQTTFRLLSPALERFEPFDPYEFQSYGRASFEGFTEAVAALSKNLEAARDDAEVDTYWFAIRGFPADALFANDFAETRARLHQLTQVSAMTLEDWLTHSDKLQVLGL